MIRSLTSDILKLDRLIHAEMKMVRVLERSLYGTTTVREVTALAAALERCSKSIRDSMELRARLQAQLPAKAPAAEEAEPAVAPATTAPKVH